MSSGRRRRRTSLFQVIVQLALSVGLVLLVIPKPADQTLSWGYLEAYFCGSRHQLNSRVVDLRRDVRSADNAGFLGAGPGFWFRVEAFPQHTWWCCEDGWPRGVGAGSPVSLLFMKGRSSTHLVSVRPQ